MIYESPAKLNLSLLVHARDASGMHPIESLVQTIELLDTLEFEEAGDLTHRRSSPAGAPRARA